MSDEKFIALIRYIGDGSSLHGDFLGLSPDQDYLNALRVAIYNSMVDHFALLQKDEYGHIKIDVLTEQQRSSWGLFIKLCEVEE